MVGESSPTTVRAQGWATVSLCTYRGRGRGRDRLAGTVDGCSRQRTPSGASADSPEARTCDRSDSPGRLWLEWCDGERSNASGTGSSRPALSTSRCAQRRRTAARSPARACCDPQGSGCFRQTTVRMSGSDPTTTPSRTPGAPAVRTITAAVRRSAPRRSRRPSSICAGAAAMKPSSPRTNRPGDCKSSPPQRGRASGRHCHAARGGWWSWPERTQTAASSRFSACGSTSWASVSGAK